MTDTVLMSNKKSAVFSTLLTAKNTDVDVLTFKADLGISNLKLATFRETKTFANAVTSLTWDLPANGILRRMSLVFEDTSVTTAYTFVEDGILNRIQKVAILNNSSELLKMYGPGIRSWINEQSLEDQVRINAGLNMAGGAQTAAGNVTASVCPLPFSFCNGDARRYWDLQYMDKISLQLDLSATTGAAGFAGMTSAGSFGSGSVTLYTEFIQLDAESLAKYRAIQFPAERPALFLLEDQELDRSVAITGSTEIQLNSNVPAIKTVVQSRITADSVPFPVVSTTTTAADGITAFAMKANGTDILREHSAYRYQVMSPSAGYPLAFLTLAAGAAPSLRSVVASGTITVDYTLGEVEGENCFKGGVAFVGLTGKALELTLEGTTAKNVMVLHRFMKYIQVAAGTGRPVVVSAV